MSSFLYTLGRWAYGSRRLVVVLWIAVLALAGSGALLFTQGTDNSFAIPGTESQEALDSLERTFPQVSGSSAQIVVVTPDGESVDEAGTEQAVADAVQALADIDGVAGVTDPFSGVVDNVISEDGTAAVISVQLEMGASEVGEDLIDAINAEGDLLAASLPRDSTVSVGGEVFASSMPALTITEALGLLVALVVLVLTFGSFVAAGLPLLNALLGVAITMAAIFLATTVTTISSTTPMLALMLGLAVGIDYALFIMSRHLDQLRAGMDPQESTGRAVATAGSAVVFAGLTVIIALAGLAVAGIPFLTVMGTAAAVGVGVAVLVALTLTPALLGMTSRRLQRAAARQDEKRAAGQARRRGRGSAASESPNRVADAAGSRFYRGWVRAATRWPALTIALVVGGLGLATVPALDLRLALPDAGSQAEGTQARDTYDILAEKFGPGYNGPLIVTGSIISSTDPLGLMENLGQEIERLDGVAAVPLATPNETADTGIIQVIPEGAPDSEATKTLVQEIRALAPALEDEYGVALSVTGFTAVGIDISDRLGSALLPFGILVVGLSLVLLTMVFRSIWVPVKAAVGFLLSLGASLGVVAAVFEWGWFADLLHVPNTGPVISFMPIILMGVLFGLAMDYEVFLVARIREEYVHGDARAAIEKGFLGSGKVVTAAAVIMFAVFAAFVPEGDSNIKPIALGLAVGVFVDAFLVRMTLVPAVLQLLGDRAWHMPRWLDRLLPSFDVEGEGISKELALADWPAGGVEYAVAADGIELLAAQGYRGIGLRVPPGAVLVVEGPHRSGKSALLLTLSGRASQASGLLKVAGFMMPERAAAVRGRVALVPLVGKPDPVGAVRAALREGPLILAIDDLDRVSDPSSRAELRRALTQASAVTLLVSCSDAEAVDTILPPDRRRVFATTESAFPERIEAHA